MTEYVHFIAKMMHRHTPIARLLKASGVSRYHTDPFVHRQSVGEHTWRVLAILLHIWPDAPRHLLIATHRHDVEEAAFGDHPAPSKWNDPVLKKHLDEKSDRYMSEALGLKEIDLTPGEIAMMKCCDYLELADHCGWSDTYDSRQIAIHGLEAVQNYARNLPTSKDVWLVSAYVRSCMTAPHLHREVASAYADLNQELKAIANAKS